MNAKRLETLLLLRPVVGWLVVLVVMGPSIAYVCRRWFLFSVVVVRDAGAVPPSHRLIAGSLKALLSDENVTLWEWESDTITGKVDCRGHVKGGS